MSGIYIHIPFCACRCLYCGFYSTTRLEARDNYVMALCSEIRAHAGDAGFRRPSTLYIGGGTPSQLSPEQIGRIIGEADRAFGLEELQEATIECNPDDISDDFLTGISRTPINRISLGIQSLDDAVLRFIRRRHTASQAIDAVRRCADSGISNISADLIYGLPGQTAESFRNDIVTVAGLGVMHISAYCLTYEEGTPLYRLAEEGRLRRTDDDTCADMYTILCDTMRSLGFVHYETSNFCRPGFHSRHNSCYWDGTHYLGLGAGAHSFDGRTRRWNVSDIDRYMESAISGSSCQEYETLSEADLQNEMVMLSLRTHKGLSMNDFRARFGNQAADRIMKISESWIQKGDLIREGDTLRLSEPGLFLGDGIVCSLFVG